MEMHLVQNTIVEIRPHRNDGRGYLVPAVLHAFHGKVDRCINPQGDSYIVFPTLIDAERAIREAGFQPTLQQGARSFPDQKVVLPRH
jgi:hypothetical protein